MNTVSDKQMVAHPFELLLDQERIDRRVAELGARITKDYAGKSLVLVGILKGCVVFLVDLMRHINLPIELEFISAASYRNGSSQEEDIILGGGVQISLKGRHVLLVEGIVDSGRTAVTVTRQLKKQEPASLEIVTLLDKPASHRTDINPKYKGFMIGNEFVIGYGLDNMQRYRNLPFVGRLLDR